MSYSWLACDKICSHQVSFSMSSSCYFINLWNNFTILSDVIRGNDAVLLIGFTGAGKSTLIHFLAGAKMTETVIDGTHHIHPVMPHHRKELELFVTSYIPKSETKALRAIELR